MQIHRANSVEQRCDAVLFFALVVVGLVGGYRWVVRPHVGALQASQRYVRSLDAYDKKNTAVNAALHTQRARLEKLTSEWALRSDMVFSPAKAGEFLSDLPAFCVQCGCVMGAVNYVDNQEKPASAIKPRTASLSVEGTYNNVIRLIQKLKARPHRVVIESLRMAAVRTDSRIVNCSLVITIYVRDDEEN